MDGLEMSIKLMQNKETKMPQMLPAFICVVVLIVRWSIKKKKKLNISQLPNVEVILQYP